MTSPRSEYKEAQEGIRKSVDKDNMSEEDAESILKLCKAYDGGNMEIPLPSDGELAADTKYKEVNTLRGWATHLKRIAERLDTELTEASADDINRLMTEMKKGTHPAVKDGGLVNNTIRNYQAIARRFFRYHDFGPEPEAITLIKGDETDVDDRDMLTQEEIEHIRKSADDPRDRLIFDLILWTGQRNTALRSLRIRDIDLEEGVYYLNDEADGLKSAPEVGKKRPLLGSEGAIREWLKYHPEPDNPDAHLITTKPGYSNPKPEEMVSIKTLNRAMKKLKENAGIDKPMSPHKIRHNFVTICKREFELDDAHVKWLIGHRAGSQVMNTTYSHLSDDEKIKNAEIAAGITEPDDEDTSLSPSICHCGEPLSDGAKACERCGTVYSPDAQAVKEGQEKTDELALDGMREADDEREADAVEDVRQYLKENPEEAVELLQEYL